MLAILMPARVVRADMNFENRIAKATQFQRQCLCDRLDMIGSALDLIHEFQRERGLTNLWIGQSHNRSEPAWLEQTQRTDQQWAEFCDTVAQWCERAGRRDNQVSLLRHLSMLSPRPAVISELRHQVAAGHLNAAQTTRAWSDQIADLSALVFSALQLDLDAELYRPIATLMPLIQAKEYTGQERAWASFGLAIGQFDDALIQRIHRIRNNQANALDAAKYWLSRDHDWGATHQAFIALQGMIDELGRADEVPESLTETWFSVVSDWIDRLHDVQREQLDLLRGILTHKPARPPAILVEVNSLKDRDGVPFGLYQVLNEQSQHLIEMRKALDTAKRALASRKQIEQAKGYLMKYQNLSEQQAFELMRNRAMEAGLTLEQIAQRIIDKVKNATSAH